jgi:hypothetical protein
VLAAGLAKAGSEAGLFAGFDLKATSRINATKHIATPMTAG